MINCYNLNYDVLGYKGFGLEPNALPSVETVRIPCIIALNKQNRCNTRIRKLHGVEKALATFSYDRKLQVRIIAAISQEQAFFRGA